MHTGRMRYRITIEENAERQDADGNVLQDWQPKHTVWADIVPVSGREHIAAEREASEVTTKIYIRYLPDITAKMRVVHGDTVYEILEVLGDARSGMLTILGKTVY